VYEHDPYTTPGRVVLKYGENWPTTRSQRNAVTITFVAGYEPGDGDVSTVPKLLKQGMLMRIAHWNENREDSAPVNLLPVPAGADYCDRLYRFSGALNIDELGLND
jgi:hypothetical protein